MKRPPGTHPSTKRTSPTSRPWTQDSDRLSEEEESEIDDIHRKRLESMLAVDEMVGSLVEELEAAGELDNTYIF